MVGADKSTELWRPAWYILWVPIELVIKKNGRAEIWIYLTHSCAGSERSERLIVNAFCTSKCDPNVKDFNLKCKKIGIKLWLVAHSINKFKRSLCYAETKHPDWLLQVTLLMLTNLSALFQHCVHKSRYTTLKFVYDIGPISRSKTFHAQVLVQTTIMMAGYTNRFQTEGCPFI